MQTAHEVILDYMTLNENKGQVGYPLLSKAMDLSWYKIFKKTKESVVKKWYEIGPGGIVPYPKTMEVLMGVYTVDSCGDLAVLDEDNIISIDPPPKLKCKCNACDHGECMCPTIQDSITQTDVIIDGVTRTNKVVSRVLKNGDVVEETITWSPSYNSSGTFVSAQEVKTQVTKCSLDILPCGCPVDCEENITKLYKCGCLDETCIPSLRVNFPALSNDFGYYKKDDEKKEIHLFNSNGKKTKLKQVRLVFQSNGKDMMIPEYATMCVMALLNYTRMMFSPSFDFREKREAKRTYKAEKNQMLKFLNPIPYNYFIQLNEIRKQSPYYSRPHSDFVTQEVVKVCDSSGGNGGSTGNITNITYIGGKFLKVVVGEDGGPVAGLDTYQNDALRGLGSNSNDRIEIEVDKIAMLNWGSYPEFTLNKVSGEITMLNDYLWQGTSTLKVDLTQ